MYPYFIGFVPHTRFDRICRIGLAFRTGICHLQRRSIVYEIGRTNLKYTSLLYINILCVYYSIHNSLHGSSLLIKGKRVNTAILQNGQWPWNNTHNSQYTLGLQY